MGLSEAPAPIPRDTLLLPFARLQAIGVCAKEPEPRFMRIEGKLQLVPFFVFGDLFQHGDGAFVAASTSTKYVIAGQVSIKSWLDVPPGRRIERERRIVHIGGEEPKRGIRIHTKCMQCGENVLEARDDG